VVDTKLPKLEEGEYRVMSFRSPFTRYPIDDSDIESLGAPSPSPARLYQIAAQMEHSQEGRMVRVMVERPLDTASGTSQFSSLMLPVQL